MPIGVSSAPYAKFVKPGDRHGGQIVECRVVQTIDFDTKRPQYLQQNADGSWARVFVANGPDGKPNDPICQWEITVDTGVEDENGDTERRIFVDPRKGRKHTLLEGKRGGDAVATALKKAKAHRVGLEIGGTFYLISGEKVRDGSGPATNTWTAEYEPPAGGVGTGKAVDEVPWLTDGTRYDKAAALEKWERSGGVAAPAAAPSQPTDDGGLAERQAEARSRISRAQASSPAARSLGMTPLPDDEPPF
jgi:hypothetical protein